MVSIVIFVFQTTPDNLVGGSLQRQILQLSPWAHAGFEPAIHSDQTMRVTSYTNGPYEYYPVRYHISDETPLPPLLSKALKKDAHGELNRRSGDDPGLIIRDLIPCLCEQVPCAQPFTPWCLHTHYT